jgi:cytochrome c oxidase assembly protein subunit 15
MGDLVNDLGRDSVRRLVGLLAGVGAVLLLVVIVSSAFLRLSDAGLSCGDWPACYGAMHHAAEATTGERVARLAHRFTATGVTAVLIALLTVALRQRPRLRRVATIASAGLAIAAVLAVIGAVSSEAARDAPLAAVTLANLAGGFALLALMGWLRQETLASPKAAPNAAASAPAAAPRWLPTLAGFALAALVVQVLLGGLVSARFAGLACPSFPLCGADAPPGSWRNAFNPFATLALDASRTVVRPAALASLHWSHRVVAHVVLLLDAVLAVTLYRAGLRSYAIAVAALTIVTIALGAASVLNALPLGAVLAHNLVAALLLATLVALTARLRAGQSV